MRRSSSWGDRVDRLRRVAARDDGSASLEFITAGMILLVPLVYLILAVSVVQGASLAVEGAARQAARVYVRADDTSQARTAADRAIRIALADYGLDSQSAEVSVSCSVADCLTRLETVTISVGVQVSMPLVPPVLEIAIPARIPLSSSATQTVSRFWGS
ncbi:MAG: hypothetical protein RI885_2495 [Actinomycetota bacterium]|jgi:Flp pilus assembly protein TadG